MIPDIIKALETFDLSVTNIAIEYALDIKILCDVNPSFGFTYYILIENICVEKEINGFKKEIKDKYKNLIIVYFVRVF